MGLIIRRSLLLVPACAAVVCAGAVRLAAQGPVTPAPPAAPPPVATAGTTVPPPPTAQAGYSYKPDGRRDPFVSLLNRGSDTRQAKKKPDGPRGFTFDEITLRGVVQARSGPLALVQGPDSKTYIVHVGDQFYDAVVKSITTDSLVVVQEVNDPLSLAKQRERRKTLRVVEEVK
jgi:Tfp pilus assembly protein PilP